VPPLIKDYVDYRRVEYLTAVTVDSLTDSLRTFLPTDGLIELLNRVLDSIIKKFRNEQVSPMDAASILLTGGNGVGKTHLMSLIYSLIREKGKPAPGLSDPRIQHRRAALWDIEPVTIWVDLGENVGRSLPEVVLTRYHEEYQNRYHREIFDPSLIAGIDTIKAHELITFNVASEAPVLLMLDGLSKRAESRTVQQLNEDIEFLSFIAYSSKSTQLFLLVAAHEDFFSPKSPLGIDATLMAQTLENFRIEWIDRANLKEIICRHVLKKNSRQQLDLRKLFAFIKAKLPNFQFSENEFSETYPFHPLIFELAEKLKGKIPSFSLLEFVISTYPKVSSRRAISLVTIDTLFDRMEFEIKTNPRCQRLFAIYQDLADQAVLRLEDRWRLWGKMLLKATFLFTLSDRAPSVRDLADSLLLFEDSETGLSYNVVGMILGQMEKAMPHGFTTTDDRLDRTFRLGGADLREELNKYLLSIASQIPDSNPRISETLLAAARKYYPDWPLPHDPVQGVTDHLTPLQVTWRGTERSGFMMPSQRFRKKDYQTHTVSDDAVISDQLPQPQEIEFNGDLAGEPLLPSEGSNPQPEWLLWIEPLGLTPEEEALIKGRKMTEIHWIPSRPTDEQLLEIKRIIALQLTEKSASSDFNPSDLSSFHEELDSQLASLFQDLYLNHGKIVTSAQTLALNQGHLECRTFRSLLNYLFKPNFDQLYSSHPGFGHDSPSVSQVMMITHRLFANQDPTNSEVQRLAAQYALPLGLVSRSEGLYELNLSITPPLFLSHVIQYLETLDASERPVLDLYEIVHRPPFGLTWTPLYLILAALVADGQIELVDPDSAFSVARENLVALENIQKIQFFRKIQTHRDYPIEVLTQWCRLITGRQDLSDISTSRGRIAATAALGEWVRNWQDMDIPKRLDSLPNEFLTTHMWRRMAWTKRRFEKLAEIVTEVLGNETPLIQGMGRIIELFGENLALLEKASRNLVEMSHFLHWMERLSEARAYLLSAEKTEHPELENEKAQLLQALGSIHDLLTTEKANQFEGEFQNYKDRYIQHYAARHDQSVGPLGEFVKLDELESSWEFRNLQFLASLPLGDPSYVTCLDEWIVAFRDYRCTLPVRDLLQSKPSCNCAFNLTRPLNLGEITEDLKAFLDLGLAHHREALAYYRHVIEPQLITPDGQVVENLDAIQALLGEGTIPELDQKVIDQLSQYISGHILEEHLDSPLPLIAPSGRITKKQLVSRIQTWLETLSNKEDILFTLKD
jgi:hypothetical protein